MYFKLTGRLARSRNNEVGIVSILKNNIGRANGMEIRSGRSKETQSVVFANSSADALIALDMLCGHFTIRKDASVFERFRND